VSIERSGLSGTGANMHDRRHAVPACDAPPWPAAGTQP
jgi:hypothetical protein